MRRAKIYVTDIQPQDRISKTRDGEPETVYRVRNMGAMEWEVSTTTGGSDITRTMAGTRMFWIEIP